MHRPLTPSSGVAEDCNLLAVCMQAQYDYVQKGILTYLLNTTQYTGGTRKIY